MNRGMNPKKGGGGGGGYNSENKTLYNQTKYVIY